MTNDKVIWNIQKLKHHLMDENYDVEALFTLDVAIEALKGEQSYQQTIYKLTETIKEKDKREQWIPCSERLPEDCNILIYDVNGNNPYVCIGLTTIKDSEHGTYCYDTKHIEDMLKSFPNIDIFKTGYLNRIIAWMPLPEPYKEPQNED